MGAMFVFYNYLYPLGAMPKKKGAKTGAVTSDSQLQKCRDIGSLEKRSEKRF
jgi:hypothetical protein